MPLKDKLKATATQFAQKAQEAGKAGQAKVEELQARRRADSLLRNLGAAVYAEKTGRGGVDVTKEIDDLISALKAHEALNGPIDANGDDADENEKDQS